MRQSKATVAAASIYGLITGLVGIEHALGEILQGNHPPGAVYAEARQ